MCIFSVDLLKSSKIILCSWLVSVFFPSCNLFIEVCYLSYVVYIASSLICPVPFISYKLVVRFSYLIRFKFFSWQEYLKCSVVIFISRDIISDYVSFCLFIRACKMVIFTLSFLHTSHSMSIQENLPISAIWLL